MIHPGIVSFLQNLSGFIATVRDNNLYISQSTTYEQLGVYHRNHRNLEVPSSTASKSLKPSKTEKVPQFILSKFVGDRLGGAHWIKGVVRKFKGQGIKTYLTDNTYCNVNSDWSSAFASRLLDSLINSDILQYITTKLKDEGNCAEVWEVIYNALQSTDLTLARVLNNWQDFFRLWYETLK